jgi:bacterioferritin-associated ferredoxin
MADSAYLTGQVPNANSPEAWHRLADTYPPHVGWLVCDEKVSTVLTLNSLYLTRDEAAFPLMARVRVYGQSKEVLTHFTGPLNPMESLSINMNELLKGRAVQDGYMEIAAYPLNSEGLQHAFFGEMWASVFTADGQIALNYPPLNFKGVDAKMVDADYLYYPGVLVDERFTMALLMLNQYDFDTHFDLILRDASGKKTLERRFEIVAKSVKRIVLDEEFSDISDFFSDGPGLLVTHFPYKMNGYVQTILRELGRICGMDHLGYLAMSPETISKLVDPNIANRRRLKDNVVCYCKSVPESHIKALQLRGLDFDAIRSECGAGTVCKGCVADLQQILKIPLSDLEMNNS